MRILHTSDWHIGKKIGRYDRMPEYREVLGEVAEIADREKAELVLVSGDVWDRPIPPVDAIALVIETLIGLGKTRPVVVVAGNHDSPDLFEALAPLMSHQNVHMMGHIRRPDQGGILGPEVLGIPASVACFPFLREGTVVDFMKETGSWYGQYAERIKRVCEAYNQGLQQAKKADPDTVGILTAHFMVSGISVAKGAPRGERELHMGEAYAADVQAIPAGPNYVAMGHIHAPQPVPSAPVPAEYAGSLLPLDFGEANETKRVVMVDAKPGQIAEITSIPLTSGRPLVRVSGTWSDIEARADELKDSFLDLTVTTAATDTTLAERARDTFPYLVKVRAAREGRSVTERPSHAGRSWMELFRDYYQEDTAQPAPDELMDMLRQILEEADATA